jgi:hypothetical protein
MRKLLLGTTALAAAATISANALADVTISGSYEFKYLSRSSNETAKDGTSFAHGDTNMVVNFTNKTDSGLDLTFRYDISNVGSTDNGAMTIDEASLAIAGGFGKIVLGMDDDAGDSYNIDEMDLIAEEPSISITSSSISSSSGVGGDDNMKIAYHLPAMGGLTAGVSHTDSGNAGTSDVTSYGAQYAMSAGGAAVTLAYAHINEDNATEDKTQTNTGIKIVSGDVSVVVSQMSYEEDDEDRDNQGGSISYKLPNGMTVGAFTFKSEDDDDAGEEYQASGAEVQYNIASGLKATISVVDYDYKVTTGTIETAKASGDSGTATQLTIGATF